MTNMTVISFANGNQIIYVTKKKPREMTLFAFKTFVTYSYNASYTDPVTQKHF